MNEEIIVRLREKEDFVVVEDSIYMKYKDETWGSCRHWQTIVSIREVNNEEEARAIVEAKDNNFAPCWEFNEELKEWNDSARNRHRFCVYSKPLSSSKLYLVRVYEKHHPSCNRSRWYKRFAYYLVKDGKVTELQEKILNGL